MVSEGWYSCPSVYRGQHKTVNTVERDLVYGVRGKFELIFHEVLYLYLWVIWVFGDAGENQDTSKSSFLLIDCDTLTSSSLLAVDHG